MADTESTEFQRAAEAFAAAAQVPVDPNVKRRTELANNLFATVQVASQARANLIACSQREGGSTFRDATNWREKEAQAQMALAALIEFEAGLLA